MTGSWVDHPNPEHIGLYDPRGGCPEWAEDFNCLRPYPPALPNPDLAAREFRKARASETPNIEFPRVVYSHHRMMLLSLSTSTGDLCTWVLPSCM